MAARLNYIKIGEHLLESGASPQLRDKDGFNASYWARGKGYDYFNTVLKLPRPVGPGINDIASSWIRVNGDESLTSKAKKKKNPSKKKK